LPGEFAVLLDLWEFLVQKPATIRLWY
jgi:hypothetical protein